MNDKIKCKIEFEVSSEEKAREIYETICVGKELNMQWISFAGNFDIYCEAIKRVTDEKSKEDFWKFVLYEHNYHIWHDEYISCEIGELELHGDKVSFTFKSLRSVPSMLVMLFADRFKMPFTLKYIEKTGEDWGIQTYRMDEKERLRTRLRRYEEDLIGLHIELMGYKPDLEILLRQLGPDLEKLLCKFGPDLETIIESLDPESTKLLSKFDIY